ncbi:MAG TPA: AAA family ATPase [Acidimicrobiia bacterium]|nr:AAA family ATPase [Acidimicrobiia bacterium]
MTQAGEAGIVGRVEPLRRVGQAISASAQGHRSAVLVSGEAGIGKTSLIRAAIHPSTADAVIAGWGTCWHGEGAPGFWPWMQAFGDLVRAVGLDAAVAAAGHDRDTLSVVIRDLGPAVETTDDPDRHRLLLLDVAVRWLEALAADRHVVIVLDDLQWADSSTFDLLDHVIAAPVTARLVVIGAYRHDELDHDARARLATVGSHADHVHLEGLSVEGVEELVGAICDPATARTLAPELHRRTGGHPLFVSELARLPELGAGGQLPTVVTGAVARRLETLPNESRRVLEAASVLGNRLLPDVLGSVVDESSAVIVRRLGPAIDAGLIRTAPGDELWFTHDLFRETLVGHLDATDRSELHGRIGDALEARNARGAPVPPGDLAGHFAQAIRISDPARAIHWAREAAVDERRRSAFSEAGGHLRRVRRAALDAGWRIEPELLVRLLMDEADNQARSGDPDVARGLLVEAANVAPGSEQQADVALAVQRLGAKFAAPRDEIITQLESALTAVTGVDLTRQAQLTAALARELQHSVAEDRLRAGALSEQALALGRESNDDATLAACLLARHDALWGPGTGVERSQLGHEIAVVGSRLGDTDRLAEGLILEANGLLESGSAGFRSVLDRWFGLLETRDEPRDRYMIATRRAALALLEGDTDQAEALMHEAARIGEQIHEPDTGNVLMSQRVALARARNHPDELTTLAADAVRWWTGAPVLAHAVAAGASANAGDLEAAAREVATVAESGGWHSEGSYLRSVLVAHLAEAATALGDTELCRELLADIEHLTDSCGVNGAVVAFAGPFAHTAGILAGALGDHDYANTMLRQSIDIGRRLGANVWVRQGEAAQRSIAGHGERRGNDVGENPDVDVASLTRTGRIWSASWRSEHGSLPHVKGLADIVVLVRHRGQEVSALELAGGASTAAGSSDELIDLEALAAYRSRLDELGAEIDQAESDADITRVESLEQEREQLLAEIRRATGLGGRLRTNANDPAERARKAVSARIREAIRRLDAVAPSLAAHLDRSIQTGLRCSYAPAGEDAAIRWSVDG